VDDEKFEGTYVYFYILAIRIFYRWIVTFNPYIVHELRYKSRFSQLLANAALRMMGRFGAVSDLTR
jgi:hypothetical protein